VRVGSSCLSVSRESSADIPSEPSSGVEATAREWRSEAWLSDRSIAGFLFALMMRSAWGASWATPDDVNARDQYSMELFYRLHLTQRFELNPDIQIIVDPAYNAAVDVIVLFGVRGRLTF